MLTCIATFPDVITARIEADMMAAPAYPAQDVQTAAVTAADELPFERLPHCAVVSWRSFIQDFHSLEDSGPSLLAPRHETTTSILDLARPFREIPPPSTVAVPGVLPGKADESEQSMRCLSPHEDGLGGGYQVELKAQSKTKRRLKHPYSMQPKFQSATIRKLKSRESQNLLYLYKKPRSRRR